MLRSLIAETYLKSLELENIHVVSSGTNVNWGDPQEREYFDNTLAVLQRHGIKQFAKNTPEQLTQRRIDTNQDIIVLMNQRVTSEASRLVTLPGNILNWNIIDIGEGHRTDQASRESYEEEIYQEITQKVDDLMKEVGASSNPLGDALRQRYPPHKMIESHELDKDTSNSIQLCSS